MRRTGPAPGSPTSSDIAAVRAAEDAAAAHSARCELESQAADRHNRLREFRRASGELLGIMSVGSLRDDLINEFPSPANPGPGVSAGPGRGPAVPPLRRGAAAGEDSEDAVLDLESGDHRASSSGTATPRKEGAAGAARRPLLAPIALGRQLTLQFYDVKGYVPLGFSKPSAGQRLAGRIQHPKEGLRKDERQIMFGLTGAVRPGEVLALMGPSGSGKTTLLSVLGGRPAKALRVTGSLTVNGHAYTKATRRRIGFVLQDDVLYEDLTVMETLRYAALLRLPRDMSREEKEGRVEAVIDVLGVRKSKGTIIGGFLRRGISGGERKRVSIGNELLINPAILMLDEPTSGLDSTSALHLINLLQDLASDGRAIVSTIHQPSSRLYGKLDSLMLLAEGHLMYSGPAQDVVPWFERFGLRVPFGTSIADFVLDVSMGEAGTLLSGSSGEAAVRELCAAAEGRSDDPKRPAALPASRFAAGPSPFSEASREGPGFGGTLAVDGAAGHGKVRGHKQQTAGGDGERREGATYREQVSVLVGRAIKVRRFEQLTGGHFFQLIFVAAIAGLVWWQRGSTYTRLNGVDVLGLLFFELLFPSFRALFHALFTFPNEFRMLMKERPAGLYKLSAYYLARTIADVPIEMLNTVLFVLIAYWFGGLNRNAADFFANLGTMILVVMVAEAWGLLLGGIFMQPKKAQTATTVIMLTFLLVGGYYARSIPVFISWVRYISFLYWGFNILTKIQFRRYEIFDCGGEVTSSSSHGYTPDDLRAIPGCSPIADVQTTLGLPADPHAPAWPDAVILIAMLVALRLAIYYTLKVKTRTRKLLMA